MGVTIYKHYCGKIMVKQSIGISPENCCKGPCKGCHNERKQLKITDSFEANSRSFNFKTQISKVFDLVNFSIELLKVTNQVNITNRLYYKVKTCENSISPKGDSSALLQVFRL